VKPDRAKYLVPDEFRRLLAASKQAGSPSKRHRNYTMFCLAGNLGLRISELVDLRVDDFHFEHSSRPFVRIRTKKQGALVENDLALDPKLARLVKSYINRCLAPMPKPGSRRAAKMQGRRCLFPSAGDSHKPITSRAVQQAFKQAAQLAKLEPETSFHSLRHYRGCQIWAATKDIVAVQKFLRHRSVSSSSVYMHMSDEEEQKVNARVGVIT